MKRGRGENTGEFKIQIEERVHDGIHFSRKGSPKDR